MQYRCRFSDKAVIQSFSNALYMSRHVCCGLFSVFYLGGGKIQQGGRNFSLDYATTVASSISLHCQREIVVGSLVSVKVSVNL